MASPRPRTQTVPPPSSRFGQGCISWMPAHCSAISATGVPRLRCSEMSRHASSVTPCSKLPPLPSVPKTSKGSPSSSTATVT